MIAADVGVVQGKKEWPTNGKKKKPSKYQKKVASLNKHMGAGTGTFSTSPGSPNLDLDRLAVQVAELEIAPHVFMEFVARNELTAQQAICLAARLDGPGTVAESLDRNGFASLQGLVALLSREGSA